MHRPVLCLAACTVLAAATASAREMPLPRWDWVLSGPVDIAGLTGRSLHFVGLDAFDTAAETVAALEAEGIAVWCYISAGTIEDWRPDHAAYLAADAAATAAGGEALIGQAYDEWPGERWLNPRAVDALMPLIEARLAMCAEKGFDMVEFDNIDGYANDTGFAITRDEAVAFARALAEAAERHGLAPILKNVPELTGDLADWYAAYLMEDCVLHETCESGLPFRAAVKPVMNAEYPESYAAAGLAFDLETVCYAGEDAEVGMLIKPLELTMGHQRCP